MAKEPKPTRVWDNCIKLGEVMKYADKKLVVELVARDGVKNINIREWYRNKTDRLWRPAFNGVSIPLLIPIEGELIHPMHSIIEFILEATKLAPTFSVDDPANAVYATKKVRNKDVKMEVIENG